MRKKSIVVMREVGGQGQRITRTVGKVYRFGSHPHETFWVHRRKGVWVVTDARTGFSIVSSKSYGWAINTAAARLRVSRSPLEKSLARRRRLTNKWWRKNQSL